MFTCLKRLPTLQRSVHIAKRITTLKIASLVRPVPPRSNDATICGACGRLSLYVIDELETVTLRIPTKAELDAMRKELDADIAQVIIMGFAIANTKGVDE